MFITLEYGFCKCEFQVLAYKYFFNDFNKESHFTFLVFVYHVWLLIILISIQICNDVKQITIFKVIIFKDNPRIYTEYKRCI